MTFPTPPDLTRSDQQGFGNLLVRPAGRGMTREKPWFLWARCFLSRVEHNKLKDRRPNGHDWWRERREEERFTCLVGQQPSYKFLTVPSLNLTLASRPTVALFLRQKEGIPGLLSFSKLGTTGEHIIDILVGLRERRTPLKSCFG